MKIERIWAMPNKQTFAIAPIRFMLLEEIVNGTVVEPFAYIGTLKAMFSKNENVNVINNDLNTEYNTDYHMDALDFLRQFETGSVDVVVYDPPYSPRQVMECYNGIGKTVTQEDTQMSFWSRAKEEIARITKAGGKAICFGWNSMGIGLTRGFEMNRVLLVPHGGGKKRHHMHGRDKERRKPIKFRVVTR